MDTQLPLFPVSITSEGRQEPMTPYTIAIYRVALVREASVQAPSEHIHHSKDAAALVRQHLSDVDREHFVTLLLNRKNVVIGITTVSVGSLTASVVSPREVFKAPPGRGQRRIRLRTLGRAWPPQSGEE